MIKRICEICNKEFLSKYLKKKYCSRICLAEGKVKIANIYSFNEFGEKCRICKLCCKLLVVDNFYIDKATGNHRSKCIVCMANRHADYRKTDNWKIINKRCRATTGRFSNFNRRAIKIGREQTITESEFWEFVIQPCYYCGGELEKTGCGLDRIDSDLGVIIYRMLCLVVRYVIPLNQT